MFTRTRTPRTKGLALALIAALALAALIPASASAAKKWKAGVYEGTIKAGNSNRPNTDIKLKITKKRIKLLEATFILECDGDRGTERVTVEGGGARITPGAVGGGYSINEQRTGPGYEDFYDVTGGVKKKKAQGLVGMSRTYDEPYENCIDDIQLDFKARKR